AAVREVDHEIALAADGEVEVLFGGRDIALTHDAGGGRNAHARADLDADRNLCAGFRGRGPGAAVGLVEQVLELGALALEAGGAHVGDVVGDDFDIALLRGHAGRCDVESFHGLESLLAQAWVSPSRWMAERRSSSC